MHVDTAAKLKNCRRVFAKHVATLVLALNAKRSIQIPMLLYASHVASVDLRWVQLLNDCLLGA